MSYNYHCRYNALSFSKDMYILIDFTIKGIETTDNEKKPKKARPKVFTF